LTKSTDIRLSIYGIKECQYFVFFSISSSGATERNCFISPDFVNSLTYELPYIDRRMSVLFVFFPVSFSGATPTGIHVTSDNNIILGAVEKVF
jgi:hypothetical protein